MHSHDALQLIYQNFSDVIIWQLDSCGINIMASFMPVGGHCASVLSNSPLVNVRSLPRLNHHAYVCRQAKYHYC